VEKAEDSAEEGYSDDFDDLSGEESQSVSPSPTSRRSRQVAIDLKAATVPSQPEAEAVETSPAGMVSELAEEEAEVAKKTQLKSMALPELKELIASKGLETSSKKDAMIDALLAHDAKCRDDARAHSVKVSKMSEKLREDFEAQTNNELKELCISKGLKPGIAKEDRVQRLIEDAQKDGTIDKKISAAARTERRATLSAMDKEALLLVCEKIGIDPFVKVVIVERILSHERCSASLLAEEESDTRPAKKARKQ